MISTSSTLQGVLLRVLQLADETAPGGTRYNEEKDDIDGQNDWTDASRSRDDGPCWHPRRSPLLLDHRSADLGMYMQPGDFGGPTLTVVILGDDDKSIKAFELHWKREDDGKLDAEFREVSARIFSAAE